MLVDLSYLPFTISNDWVSSERMALYLTGISIRVRVDTLCIRRACVDKLDSLLVLMVLLLHSTEEQLQRVETSFCTNPISESWTLPNPRPVALLS
jgi:hypothetical protein